MDWETIRSEKGPNLKLFDTRFDWVKHPVSGHEAKVVILESPDSANVIPITAEGQILLIRQYRFGIGAYTLELPGGLVNPDETESKSAAERELLEETGYGGTEWHYLGAVPSNPVFMDCFIHHWVLKNAQLIGETHFDDAEEIDLVEVELNDAFNLMASGAINHPHAISALFRLKVLLDLNPGFLD
ncbi:MAG: NUDIX hydrolase [Bacteroidota bacterium]